MEYTTRQVSELLKVSIETIRQWTLEFAQYLSISAQPGANKSRRYSTEDIEVLSMVAEEKRRGLGNEDIHATLTIGQRGAAPDELVQQNQQLALQTDREKRLVLETAHLRHELELRQQELAAAAQQLAKMQETREDNVRLQTTVDFTEQQRSSLQDQVKELLIQVQELSERVGREYSKGYVDALREQRDLPTGKAK